MQITPALKGEVEREGFNPSVVVILSSVVIFFNYLYFLLLLF